MLKSRLCLKSSIVYIWFGTIVAFVTSSGYHLFPERKSINICAWSGMFDMQHIALFEKETGIRVNISYYESNEELIVKLRSSMVHGYDLIVPSDYTVFMLQQKDMLKKLDKSKMTFYPHLNKLLLNHYFDEHNDYSVPFEWSVYGLGINKECYPQEIKNHSWELVFDKKLVNPKKIIMTNDPLIAVPITAFYLYGTLEGLSKERVRAIERVLTRQRPLVEAYTDLRASYYLASKNACIAVCSSSDLLKNMHKYPSLDFIIPKEGTLVTIENFAIPSTSYKDEYVYAFMNFMMKPESVKHSYERMGFFPATTDALETMTIHPWVRDLLTMSKQEFSRFHLLRLDVLKKALSEFELQNLWIKVKA